MVADMAQIAPTWTLGDRLAKAREFGGVTAMTEVAELTGDAFLLAEFAGWSSIQTATHYVRRASVERVRNALGQREAL